MTPTRSCTRGSYTCFTDSCVGFKMSCSVNWMSSSDRQASISWLLRIGNEYDMMYLAYCPHCGAKWMLPTLTLCGKGPVSRPSPCDLKSPAHSKDDILFTKRYTLRAMFKGAAYLLEAVALCLQACEYNSLCSSNGPFEFTLNSLLRRVNYVILGLQSASPT